MNDIRSGQDGPVELQLEGTVARVLLRRPAVRNALSAELLDALQDTLSSPLLESASAVVLAGAGDTFCAGADLSVVRAAMSGDTDAVLGAMVTELHATVSLLRSLPVPVVAAVEGAAVGAGMGLALAADLRVVGRSAVFVPGYLAIGATPDGGVSYFLTRALGGPRATAVLLQNQPLQAEALLEAGLAQEVVDDGLTLVAGTALAQRVAASVPATSLLAARRLVDQATTQGLDAQLAAEEREFRAVWGGSDFREGVTAFLERRPPNFNRRPSEIVLPTEVATGDAVGS